MSPTTRRHPVLACADVIEDALKDVAGVEPAFMATAGGRTELADGTALCGWHHRRAHDETYDLTRTPNGDLRFHRRT